MALEPMHVSLSAFECLAILRQELQTLEKALEDIERRLSASLEAQARAEYLGSLSSYFQTRAQAEEIEDAAKLEEERQAIHQALEAVKQQIPQMEAQAASGEEPQAAPARPVGTQPVAPPPAAKPASPAARKRLQGFGDF